MDGDRGLALSPTFGRVSSIGDSWSIECEPHVATRLKRFFPKVSQGVGCRLKLLRSPESARDLQCFLQRFPMLATRADARQISKLARQHVAMELGVAELLAARHPPPTFDLAIPARDYQALVPQILDLRRGLLLADDVGLGKSLSAICAMTRPDNLPAVVVCPAHLPRQWQRYLLEFAPQLTSHVVRKSTPYPLLRKSGHRLHGLRDDKLPDVIIVSYHMLRGWAATLSSFARYAVFDEAQQLRHSDTNIYEACKLLADACPLRIGLSATPIMNYGEEFLYVMDCLNPGALGTRAEFLREWCSGGARENGKALIADPEAFGAWLRREGLMLRRTRAEVGRELPPVSRITHEVEADLGVLNQIQGDAEALARIIVSHNEQYKGQRFKASGEFDGLLRQATGIAKAPYVADFARLLLESEPKLIIFAWHRDVYEIYNRKLADFNPVMYTGSESPNQKDAAMRAFINGDSRVLLMSLRSGSGADGLQQACRTVVFGELDWSPGVLHQCIGRPHRDGQTDPVFAYFVTSQEGSDPAMSQVLGLKVGQIEGVLNPAHSDLLQRTPNENFIKAMAERYLQKSEPMPKLQPC